MPVSVKETSENVSLLIHSTVCLKNMDHNTTFTNYFWQRERPYSILN